MLSLMWARGLLARRAGSLLLAASGVALAVALLASIGAFLAASKATMTKRAIQTVPVDWQVQLQADADPTANTTIVRSSPAVTRTDTVWFASTSGLRATVGPTTQTTGPGVVLGLPADYSIAFPETIRPLVGATRGVLLAQQTAANLHAGPGDTVTIGRAGLSPISVTVGGVVDFPSADSLFQVVGVVPGSSAQAPPDNVVILPDSSWHAAFDRLAASRPDLVHVQVHARVDHRLPHDPSAAYTTVSRRAHRLEARLAGNGVVGDNLGATLASARTDALYAQVLFLFLGLPGAVLAGLLTVSVAGAGAARRRREQALLRTRGATTSHLVRLALVEAALVAIGGGVMGLSLAALVGRVEFATWHFAATPISALGWALGALAVGFAIAVAAVVIPAWRDARFVTVAAARAPVGHRRVPGWARLGLDVVLLAVALAVFWVTSRRGYELVLAPEGVPTISVSYWALAGPLLLWIGAGLLTWRVAELLLRRGRRALTAGLTPLAGRLASTVAASLQRQRRALAHGAALVALTVAFAASTAIFNATYRQQAEIDALLTNGAPVTVTAAPGSGITPTAEQQISATAGVRGVEPLLHRFAYVGNDLQDLYGVRPTTIVDATRLQDAYFRGGSARDLMGRLVAHPDAILVSAETVADFQLQPGDQLILRLQDSQTHQYRPVTFHYAGVAKEFPTAPSDSFIVANADYIARASGRGAVDTLLVDTSPRDIGSVARRLAARLGTAATVHDAGEARRTVGSSLTAVDLAGLTRVELVFAVALAAASTGLVLWLGFGERKRAYAITAALGARPRQLAAFIWGEGAVVTLAGFAAGLLVADALTQMLVRILTGVFDPPPAHLSVPWAYLGLVTGVAVASVIGATSAALHGARAPSLGLLRDL